MTRYISILRGINVGGKRKILMTDLKTLYEKIGFSNAITYIQSGNVIFDSKQKRSGKNIAHQIEEAIFLQYGFEVPVVVRTIDEIKKTIRTNPFLKESNVDTAKLYLTFLEDTPDKVIMEKVKDLIFLPDRYHIIGVDVFICCSGKYSDSKLSNNFFEEKLKVAATTRNWQTVITLSELATNIK